MKKITLLAILMASFITTAQVILSEDFETATLGSGFTNSWTTDGSGWVVNNPTTGTPNWGGATGIVDPAQGNCSNNYAVVDSDGIGNVSLNTSLVSPVMDLSGYSSGLLLKFNQWHRVYSSSVAYIEYSTDSGTNWSELFNYGDAVGASIYDISELEGYSAVQIRFRYTGFYEYWWGIDDISVEVGVLPEAPVAATTPNPQDEATVDLTNDTDMNNDGSITAADQHYVFTWSPGVTGDAPTAYDYYFGSSSSALSLLGETSANDGFTLYGLSTGTTYFWQVVPKNAGGSAVAASCPIWSFTTSSNVLSFNDNQLNSIVVSPNPVKDVVTINNLSGLDSVEVFNQLGQLVLKSNADLLNDNRLDLSTLNPGMYMLKIKAENKSKTVKIIKE